METGPRYLVKAVLKKPKGYLLYHDDDFKGLMRSLSKSFGFSEKEIDIEYLGGEEGDRYNLCLKADEELGKDFKKYMRCGKNVLGLIDALKPYYDPSCERPFISAEGI